MNPDQFHIENDSSMSQGKLLRAKICIARSTIVSNDEKLMNPDNFHIETRFVGLERYDTSTSRTVCTSSTY